MAGKANFASINAKILKSKRVQDLVFSMANTKFEEAKKQFMQEFNDHPVTVEIQGGAYASNSSGTLGGYGNLFSFLGFEAGSNPIGEISEAMNTMFSMEPPSALRNFLRSVFNLPRLSFVVRHPTISKLKKHSKLPWAFGGSWLSGIESGIPNFAQYLYEDNSRIKTSRSKSGVEAEWSIRGASFQPTPYLTPIIERFIASIQ